MPATNLNKFLNCSARYDTIILLAENNHLASTWMHLLGKPDLDKSGKELEPDYSFVTELGIEGEEYDRCVEAIR